MAAFEGLRMPKATRSCDVTLRFCVPLLHVSRHVHTSGKADVEFEHEEIERENQTLNAGDYIGDLALLGDEGWASSTCFNLGYVDSKDPVEIQVTPCPNEYVIALQLLRQDFVESMESCKNVMVRKGVEEWAQKQMRANRVAMELPGAVDGSAPNVRNMKALRTWERLVMRICNAKQQRPRRGMDWAFVGIEGSIKVKPRRQLQLAPLCGD